jgi:hypothetical protein
LSICIVVNVVFWLSNFLFAFVGGEEERDGPQSPLKQDQTKKQNVNTLFVELVDFSDPFFSLG